MDEPSTPPLFQVTDLASVLLRPILQLNLLPFLSQPRDWINKPSGAENDYIIVKYSVKLRAIIPDSLFLCCRGHAKRFGPFLLLLRIFPVPLFNPPIVTDCRLEGLFVWYAMTVTPSLRFRTSSERVEATPRERERGRSEPWRTSALFHTR